jgi:hypothetical protein
VDSNLVIGVGITLIIALVGGSWHVGMRLGRMTAKVDHIEDCIHRIESTGSDVLIGLDAAVKVMDQHSNQGLGELRDRIVVLETIQQIRRLAD